MIVLIAGLGFGWIAVNVHRVETQSAVISQLSSLGVQVVEWKSDPWLVVAEVLRRPMALKKPGNLRRFSTQATPSAVSLPQLPDEKIGDVIERLATLPALEWISIPKSNLSSKFADSFSKNLPKVEIVITPQ